MILDHPQKFFNVTVIDVFLAADRDSANVRGERGLSCVASAYDDNVLFLTDPFECFKLLDLPCDAGLQVLRVVFPLRQSACGGLGEGCIFRIL